MAQTARVHASNSEESGRRLQLPNKEPVSNTEHTNHRFKIPSAGRDFFSDPFIRENGSSSVVGSKNQGILNELQDYIQSTEHRTVNNNKGNSLPNKMATSSSSATNQQTANANGFQMSMNSSTGPVNKSGATSLGIPASVHLNNQLSTILDPGNTDPGSSTANTAVPSRNLTPTNPNPASMKLLASNQPALSPQNQYDQYNPRQEMLLHGSFREVPIAPRAPNAAEQYGSQQRFASARSENQLKRGLNPQTSSPFPPGYYNQDSISSQAGQRSSNSQPDERNMITNQHFQWQSRLQTSNHCSTNLPTNTSPGPPMSRAQLQQPGIPQQQLPYMMLGNSHQQQQQSHQASSQQPYAAYIMQQQGGMKAGSMSQAQPYYGNMSMSGRQVMGQTSLPTQGQQMGSQIQKPSPDYTSFQQQQQQMQHRYPQPQYPQQIPYLAQQQQRQQQQTYPQPPTAMPRMPSSHPQPILPKPASAEMFGASTGLRYTSNNGGDSLAGQDFVSNRMTDQQQIAMPSAPVSYGNPPMGRMSSSSEMMAKYGGSSQGGYQRGNPPPFPGSLHSRHSPSPNITLGSPLRNVPDGTPPSVGMVNFGTDSPATSGSMSNYPPGKLPTPFGMGSSQMSGSGVSSGHLPSSSVGSLHFSTAGSSVGGPAAVAAAAAVLEAANSGARYPNSGPAPVQPYMSSQEIMLGRVPSPTLNELPTAEDVEAMIESMRAGETSLSTNNGEEQPSRGSAPPPPSVATVSGTVESSPSQGPPSLAAQGTTVNATDQNSNSDTKQLNNSTLSMPGVSKDDNPQSVPSSPLSTFSGLSPGVSPSGVSITSSFGDAEIDLDEINPSLPNNPISMSSYQFPSSKHNQQQYDKFSKLYELSDEPERKEFLDKYQEFMNSQGTQISQVPVVARQPLDLFKFFTVVRDRGGLQEVVRRKLWQDVLEALNLPMDNPSIVNNLRNQYSRYLLSFEMKHTKQNSIDDIKINLLENSGIPPPNATVTCSEAIIPTNSLTQSQRETSSIHGSYNSMTNESPVGLPPSYNARDSYAESSYENSSKSFPDLRDSSLNFQMKQPTPPNSFGVPPYPYSGDRRQSLSNQPQGGLPPYMLSQRNMYPGPPSMSPYFQQSTPQSGHPAANYPHSQYPQRASPSLMGALSSSHSMMPSASPQDKMHVALWGSQYSPSTEPEHIVDYPPGAHSGRAPRSSSGLPPQFSPAPPYGSYPGRQQSQYSAATPPYRPSPSPSPSSRQPLAQSLQASQKMKYPHQQATQQQQQQQSQQAVKRDMPFPNDCVEATRPVFTKKRKLTSRDLGPVEAWRVMMSLKSGLLSEATWALDTLNILLYDDNTVAYFMLSQLPGLLENLIDHFRRYLTEIFGAFDESEITVGAKVFEPSGKEANEYQPSTEEEDEIDKINQNAKRSFSAVLVGSTFQFSREGFQSGSSNWLMGGGDTTLHIQTHMGSMLTEQQCQSTYMKPDTELQCSEDLNCGKVLRIYSEQKQLSSIGEKKSEALCMDMNCPRDRKCMVNCKELKKESSCPVSVKEDSESKPDSVVKTEEEQNENSTDENDDEKFTANLKKELDLDLDSDPEDSEADVYIQREVVGKMNVKQEPIIEEQSCGKEDAPLCLRTETQDAVSRRCLCVSNILRGLSFVPLNDAEMSRHAGLLLIVGRLLLLHHRHAKRVPYRRSYLQEDIELESPSDDRQDWWWYCLEGLRENALVIIANIAGQLDLSLYPEAISLPLLDGLLHWFVCPSATAEDPMPTATPGTSLSPRQLVLEALAKMSILEANVDLILSSPPLTRVDELYGMLVRLVGERGNPVTREFALVLLSNLAQGENSFVGFGDSKACISMLLEFIEDAASTLSAYSAGSALAQAGFPSENLCGTSVDMLRRAASTLVCLARIRSNRKLFLPFQQRILRLAILKVLDNMITAHLAEILFYLSR